MMNTDAILKSVAGLGLYLFDYEKVQINSYEDKVNPELVLSVADFLEKSIPLNGGVGALFQGTLKDLMNAERTQGVSVLKNEETLFFMDIENFLKRAAIAQNIVTAPVPGTEPVTNVPAALADASNSEQPNTPGSTVRPADVFRAEQTGAFGSVPVSAGVAPGEDKSAQAREQTSDNIIAEPWYDKFNPMHKKQADDQAKAQADAKAQAEPKPKAK